MEYVFYFLNIVGLVRIILIQPLNFLLECNRGSLWCVWRHVYPRRPDWQRLCA